MKNMTSPAKSCSILLCALLLFAAGCKDKNAPESLNGNVARPTWTAIEVPDMTSSMTAVIKVANLNGQIVNDSIVNEDDLLAAFSGETCLGTAQPQDGLFYLFVAGINNDPVTLRYYSAHYKNLFEAKDAFPFVNDNHLGTVAEPLICNFALLK